MQSSLVTYMDNDKQAPIIPPGTGKTVYGTNSFGPNSQMIGQAPVPPVISKPQPVAQETQQPSQSNATPKVITFDELAAKQGFKSADDLAAAYDELRKHSTRVEMSLSELVKIRQEAENTPMPEPTVPRYQEPEPQVKDNMTQEEALRVVDHRIQRMTRPIESRMALQELFTRNADATQYGTKMAELIRVNPNYSWEDAYKLAKFDDLSEKTNKEAQIKAYEVQQKKVAAMVGSSQPTNRSDGERAIEDIIRDRSVPFTEIQKIMRERFR